MSQGGPTLNNGSEVTVWRDILLLSGALAATLLLHSFVNLQPRYSTAVVVANGQACATIGRKILEANGSAVDAAIATLFCEGLTCAPCMGLGGGFLATLYDAKTGRVRVLNARDRAPAAATPYIFKNESSCVGGLAIAVPGELRGYGAMYAEYGRLPWRDLVQPAVQMSREGFTVNAYMAQTLLTYTRHIKEEHTLREVFVNPSTGDVVQEGDVIVDYKMANTLSIIARDGPEAIHSGALSAALVRDIADIGGIITEQDLANYRVEWLEPIKMSLDPQLTLYTVPLPGCGSILCLILNMWKGWIGKGTSAPIDSSLYWHRIVETFKVAAAQRTGLGDPLHNVAHHSIPEFEQKLLDKEWAQEIRTMTVDDYYTYTNFRHYGAHYDFVPDHGSVHIIVVAPDGSVVSVTSTINTPLGAKSRCRSLGIMLNSNMDNFAIPGRTSAYGLPPSKANMVGPNMQPLTSVVPSIILDSRKKLKIAFGGAGGTIIVSQVALVLHRVLQGVNFTIAIKEPRIYHQLVPMELVYEESFPGLIIQDMIDRGHKVRMREDKIFGSIVGVVRDEFGFMFPTLDHRRPGSIDGF